jgi:hypothetical protein
MVEQRHGQIPCISCGWCLVQSARLSILSNIFSGLLHVHVGPVLIFEQVLGQIVFVFLNAYF